MNKRNIDKEKGTSKSVRSNFGSNANKNQQQRRIEN